MNVLVTYTGGRASTLKEYSDKEFREGPYDFSDGPVEVDEQDAKVLLRNNPRCFEVSAIPRVVKPTVAEKDAAKKAAAEKEAADKKAADLKAAADKKAADLKAAEDKAGN